MPPGYSAALSGLVVFSPAVVVFLNNEHPD